MRYVIIGNGAAGVHAAESIRRLDSAGSIKIIAGEEAPPYCRPMISNVLEGAASFEQISLRQPDFYRSYSIDAVVGERVETVDLAAWQVITGGGRKFPYDRLLIAAGADPARAKCPGADLENVFYLRTERDTRNILSALPRVKRAVVLGGGLVGLKAAHSLLRRGISVTMLIGSKHPLSMQVDDFAGKLVLDELSRHGIDVRTRSEAAAFEGEKAVQRVRQTDGSVLACDMVIIGKGVRPAVSALPREQIEVGTGVCVNDYMETSAAGVFAAGDVAESMDIARRRRRVNALWPVAVEQGQIAGMNMAGRRVRYRGSLSRNIIRVFDLDVLTAGLTAPPAEDGCDILSRFDARRRLYRRLVFREDRLVGFVMLNSVEQGGLLMSLIHQEIPVRIPREKLLENSFNYSRVAPMYGGRS
ncbi:MAG: NAD(P)/FAD-dependent oxidoreductase [Candidatus Abyssobacteria bacterium SURF_5]|uniref:NAD(P)/FAD-dependent oxidoreductase n=1 Tax=Abyssobacteria bacterium (strain SURF_5) TaxID=2093360 RepID=A0A3A4N8Y8_ABYX5|nr:MAG: NAD(P)/FAD-dependent oxidoreductase [Candidatus Abyssubacteria bacterium SURF_5]